MKNIYSMKRVLSLVAGTMLFLPAVSAQNAQKDPEGCLVYSLPSTVIRLEVEASGEHFYAGPYAKYRTEIPWCQCKTDGCRLIFGNFREDDTLH